MRLMAVHEALTLLSIAAQVASGAQILKGSCFSDRHRIAGGHRGRFSGRNRRGKHLSLDHTGFPATAGHRLFPQDLCRIHPHVLSATSGKRPNRLWVGTSGTARHGRQKSIQIIEVVLNDPAVAFGDFSAFCSAMAARNSLGALLQIVV